MSISSKMLPFTLVGSTLIELALAAKEPADNIINDASTALYPLVPVTADGSTRYNFGPPSRVPLDRELQKQVNKFNETHRETNISCYRTIRHDTKYLLVCRINTGTGTDETRYSVCEEMALIDHLQGRVRSDKEHAEKSGPGTIETFYEQEKFIFDVFPYNGGNKYEQIWWEVVRGGRCQGRKYKNTISYKSDHPEREDPPSVPIRLVAPHKEWKYLDDKRPRIRELEPVRQEKYKLWRTLFLRLKANYVQDFEHREDLLSELKRRQTEYQEIMTEFTDELNCSFVDDASKKLLDDASIDLLGDASIELHGDASVEFLDDAPFEF